MDSPAQPGIMSDYTDETVFLTPDGAVRDLETIRDIFVVFFTLFPSRGLYPGGPSSRKRQVGPHR